MELKEKVYEKYKRLKTEKDKHLAVYDLVRDYVMGVYTGSETTSKGLQQFTGFAVKSLRTASSAILSRLWPSESERVVLTLNEKYEKSHENKKYFEFVGKKVSDVLNNPKGGLSTALDEYMQDQLGYGTSGISRVKCKDKSEDPALIFYRSWSIHNIYIDESSSGFIDTVYIEFEWTVRKIAQEYGEENLSKKLLDLLKEGKTDEKFKIIHAIEPRDDRNKAKKGAVDLPIRSIHMLIDEKHILRESGFSHMPIHIARFRKNAGATYGSSPGIDALPDVLQLNHVRETLMEAREKLHLPPLGVYSDAMLGGETIDLSSRAINVFDIDPTIGNRDPVFPLISVGDPKNALAELEDLKQAISDHFFLDRLLDFNNETQMTLGEAQMRNQLSSAAMSSVDARQIIEMFNLLIEGTVNDLFEMNELGVRRGSIEEQELIALGKQPEYIPDEIAKAIDSGEDFYEIKYLTPAARGMRAEEVLAIMRTWEFAGQAAPVKPEMLDNLNEDKSIRLLAKILGTEEILNEEKAVDEIRISRNQQVSQQQGLIALEGGAKAAKDISSAMKQ